MRKSATQKRKSSLKASVQYIIALVAIAAGMICAAYPFISNWLYEKNSDSIIDQYQTEVEAISQSEEELMLEQAHEYNRSLISQAVELVDPFSMQIADREENDVSYSSLLDLSGTGIMGYLEIPSIDVYLPIYHGTSEAVLEKGIGHLEVSSLPVGGTGTHAILTGHTGLNSARLFTDLTELENGNLFYVHVLTQTIAYKVDQIKVVNPEDTSDLQIFAKEDYVTLITCTPYGLNTHRLLVRGTRLSDEELEAAIQEEEELMEDRGAYSGLQSQWMSEYRNALIIGVVVMVVVLIAILLMSAIQKARKRAMKKRQDRL